MLTEYDQDTNKTQSRYWMNSHDSDQTQSQRSLNVMLHSSQFKPPPLWKEVTTNQCFLSSRKIYVRQAKNCAHAGTTKGQTGQNYVIKPDENCRNLKMEQHHLNEKWTYSQEPPSALPKKQFPEEGGETRLTSQAGIHSCRNSIVLSADSERRWNPALQMITQLSTTKPKQNLPDSSSNRHALHGMKKVFSQHGNRFGQVVEAY